MKKLLPVLLSLSIASLLLAGCFGKENPSGQELIKKATEAAATKESVTLEATLQGTISESGQSQSGSIDVSSISDTATDGNGEIRVGDDFLLAQVGDETYLKTGDASLRIDAGQAAEGATEDTALESADQAILNAALSAGFVPIEAAAEVSDGPEIDGEETWMWNPDLGQVDLRETLRQALDGAYEEARREDKLKDSDVREVEGARADIDSIPNEDLDKAKIVAEGIDLEVYFAKSSGLHLGTDLKIGWSAEELRQVFGDSVDVSADGSVEAGLTYRLAWSDSPAVIKAPSDAVSVESPAGQKQVEGILSDLGLGSLLGLTGVSSDDLLDSSPGKSSEKTGKSADPMVGMACASLPPGSRKPGKNCVGSKND